MRLNFPQEPLKLPSPQELWGSSSDVCLGMKRSLNVMPAPLHWLSCIEHTTLASSILVSWQRVLPLSLKALPTTPLIPWDRIGPNAKATFSNPSCQNLDMWPCRIEPSPGLIGDDLSPPDAVLRWPPPVQVQGFDLQPPAYGLLPPFGIPDAPYPFRMKPSSPPAAPYTSTPVPPFGR